MVKKRSRTKPDRKEPAEEIAEAEPNSTDAEDAKKSLKSENKSSKEKSKVKEKDGDNKKEKKKLTEVEMPRNKAMSFSTLQPPLSKDVLKYLKDQDFHTMTPVQAASIPLFLSHKDVAAQACTGSGKTLSFLVPMVEMILRRQVPFKKSQVAGIVLSPTRELAYQTFAVAEGLCKTTKLPPPLLLVGGGGSGSSSGSGANHRPVTQDLQNFQQQGSDIIVATPGRLEDILNRYMVLDVSELECLVLDEADVLLKMGFTVTLTSILSKLPKMRRTGLFSATAVGLKEWVPRAGLRNPVWVNVAVTATDRTSQQQLTDGDGPKHKDQATPASLTNYYLVTPQVEKFSRLVEFLTSHKDEKVIVFFLTCASVEFYGCALQQILLNQYVELLHGKLVQKRREKAMERFRDCGNDEDNNKKSDGGVLCCTDVAARGLDVTDLHWVVQFDAPQDPAFFVHRVGRAARAGRKGSSLLFVSRKEEPYIDLLRMRKVPLEPLPSTETCCPQQDEDLDDNTEKKSKAKSSKEATEANVDVEGEGSPPTTRVLRSAADPNLVIPDALPKLRALVLKDREMLEKGTQAFTSYIRAYKEHQCAFIFRFASLDLGFLATSFCLLRLPKMPELRPILTRYNGKLPNFESAGPEIDIYAIPYLDKARESARQKRLQAEIAAGGKNAKQIKAEQRKAAKVQWEKDRRKDAVAKGRNPDKKRGKNAQMMDEWDELAKEERLYKKLRRGKITQTDFDEEMFGDSKKKKKIALAD